MLLCDHEFWASTFVQYSIKLSVWVGWFVSVLLWWSDFWQPWLLNLKSGQVDNFVVSDCTPELVIDKFYVLVQEKGNSSALAKDIRLSCTNPLLCLRCQRQVSRACISNYIPQSSVGCDYLSMLQIPISGTKLLISDAATNYKLVVITLCFSVNNPWQNAKIKYIFVQTSHWNFLH